MNTIGIIISFQNKYLLDYNALVLISNYKTRDLSTYETRYDN